MTADLSHPAAARLAPPPSIDLSEQSPTRTEYELMGRLRLARTLRSRTQKPELGGAAFHGLAGQIVREIQPHTEASPAAMLLTLLTSVGAMIGRGAFTSVGPEPHYPVLFSLIVGPSGSGKGVSMAAVRPVLTSGDSSEAPFMRTRVVKGFQSGEALVQAAADFAPESPPDLVPTAPPPDQRMLVIESEFAKVLTVAQRQGSVLSTILRSAWDSESLECRTRKEKLIVTEAHVCVITHITPNELVNTLDTVEIANGFANRFLPVWSSPHQLTPKPGVLPSERIAELGRELRACVVFGQGAGEIGRSQAFEDTWASLYYALRLRPSGGPAFDALTARAAPHILRLALMYALLDREPMLGLAHLEAAAAVWEYCEATVAHVWGATLGDANLDRLYDAVVAAGPGGLGRVDISGLFSRNATKKKLDELVNALVSRELARVETQSTGGRPRQVVIASDH